MSSEARFLACEIGALVEDRSIGNDQAAIEHYSKIAETMIESLQRTGTYVMRPDAAFQSALKAWAKHHSITGDPISVLQQGMFAYLTQTTPK